MKDMAQEFHQLRKDNAESEDELDVRMNEHLQEIRGNQGRKTLSGVVDERNGNMEMEDDSDADGFILCDLDGFEGSLEQV